MLAYTLSDAAEAVGIPKKKLRRDADRKIIDLPKTGKGKQRPLALSTIYLIAVCHALTKVFVPPTTAMSLAKLFLEPQRGRKLGTVFESGKTLMLVTDGVGSIINLEIDQDLSPHLRETTIVVDLGAIISKVNARLIN